MLRCLIKALTGFDCPFCGTQRSIIALLKGDLVSAIDYNPFIYLISPYLILLVLCEIKVIPPYSKLYKALHGRWSIAAAAIVTVAWTVYRNIS
jgi:hypothetical protein